MKAYTGASIREDAALAAGEASAGWPAENPSVVFAFSSARQDAAALRAAFEQRYPGALVVGCSTSGERVDGAHQRGGVTAAALYTHTVRWHAELIAPLDQFDPKLARAAVERAFVALGVPPGQVEPEQLVAILLTDGLSCREEQVAAAVADALHGVPLVGGSAGDDLAFKATFVSAPGVTRSNAAVLVVARGPAHFTACSSTSTSARARWASRSRAPSRPRAACSSSTAMRQRPANDFLDPIHAAVQSLAERLDKRVTFVVRGGEVGVDPDRLAPLLRVLPHLVRNAIDHGLEGPDERGDKPAQGRVELSFADAGDHWTLTLRDDGRGIDAARVIETAQRRGILTAEQAKRVPVSSVLDVLTLEGFSTADTVTDVSGRGVGLSAVREAVESLGGSMRVDSEPGRGTTFTMDVPKQVLEAAI